MLVMYNKLQTPPMKNILKNERKWNLQRLLEIKFEAASACYIYEQEFERAVLHCHKEYENKTKYSLCISPVNETHAIACTCSGTHISCPACVKNCMPRMYNLREKSYIKCLSVFKYLSLVKTSNHSFCHLGSYI